MEALEVPRKPRRRECHASVAVMRVDAGRGIAALRMIDDAGASAEHFIPFAISETPARQGRDYVYAGLTAALERLRTLGVQRVLLQTDDAAVVEEIERRAEPHRDLTLPYILLGCKLNEFASARIIAVPAERLSALRARAASLASTFYSSVA